MMRTEENQSRIRLVLSAIAIILFCVSATALIATWAPGAIRMPADIAAMQDVN